MYNENNIIIIAMLSVCCTSGTSGVNPLTLCRTECTALTFRYTFKPRFGEYQREINRHAPSKSPLTQCFALQKILQTDCVRWYD